MALNGYDETGFELEDNEYDSNAHLATYVFTPLSANIVPNERPSKRRSAATKERASKRQKVTKLVRSANTTSSPFVPLLDGKESLDLVDLRLKTFQDFWSRRQEQIESVLHEADAAILSEIAEFTQDAPSEANEDKLPTGFIVAGASVASHTRLFKQLTRSLEGESGCCMIILDSSEAPNLKTALKSIIRSATRGSFEDAEEITIGVRKGLPYDLQILYDYMRDRAVEKLVIAFRNTEAFDNAVLAGVLQLLSSWSNRIHIVLLFGIATSVDLFEDRLPQSVIRLLQGKKFDVRGTQNVLEKILEATLLQEQVWLGPNLCGLIIDRAQDHIQSPESFIAALEYAYMSHFFANPLTVLLSEDFPTNKPHPELCEAIRNLPSFRTLCETELDAGNTKLVQSLLNNDASLIQQTRKRIHQGQKSLSQILSTVSVIHEILTLVKPSSTWSWSDAYVSAVSGTFRESSIIRDMLLSIKQLPPSTLKGLVLVLSASLPGSKHQQKWQEDLIALEMVNLQPTLPQDNIQHIPASITRALTSYLDACLPRSQNAPTAVFPHEMFLQSLPSPSNSIFTPRPRFSIERALSRPHDYLGCSCCENLAEGALSATQPPTAILWQLLQEGGAVVNVADLLRAFEEVMRGRKDDEAGADEQRGMDDEGENEEGEEKRISALFYRSLAELKYLGWVRRAGGAGRRGECLVKGGWKGL